MTYGLARTLLHNKLVITIRGGDTMTDILIELAIPFLILAGAWLVSVGIGYLIAPLMDKAEDKEG